LPTFARNSSIAAQIFLISLCANSIASTTVSSFTSLALDSIITIASALATTMMFNWLSRISEYVGLVMNLPST